VPFPILKEKRLPTGIEKEIPAINYQKRKTKTSRTSVEWGGGGWRPNHNF